MPGVKWTLEESQYLEKHYADEPSIDIAHALGKKLYSVYNRANLLGLKKSIEYFKIHGGGRLTNENSGGIKYRFVKGQDAWNKGMKGLDIGGKETRFRSGHLPHNTKWDGATRVNVEGYTEIRVSKANWKLLHRVIWEQHFGPIPNGVNIQFKDNNRSNISIENLEMVSKTDNMNRNTVHNYPPEIQKLVQIKGVLNRQINIIKKNG